MWRSLFLLIVIKWYYFRWWRYCCFLFRSRWSRFHSPISNIIYIIIFFWHDGDDEGINRIDSTSSFLYDSIQSVRFFSPHVAVVRLTNQSIVSFLLTLLYYNMIDSTSSFLYGTVQSICRLVSFFGYCWPLTSFTCCLLYASNHCTISTDGRWMWSCVMCVMCVMCHILDFGYF